VINILTAFLTRRKPKLYHKCCRIHCRKASTYYGRFVGGLCTEHAREAIDDLHQEDRERLGRLTSTEHAKAHIDNPDSRRY
jgi:hypothetical protein